VDCCCRQEVRCASCFCVWKRSIGWHRGLTYIIVALVSLQQDAHTMSTTAPPKPCGSYQKTQLSSRPPLAQQLRSPLKANRRRREQRCLPTCRNVKRGQC